MSLERKQQLVQGCEILDSFGITDEQGHLSARDPGSERTIRMNEFSSPGTASVQDFLTISLDDTDFPESAPAETVIHTEIYRHRDDVNAVCHNHSPFAVAVSSAGHELRPVHHIGAVQPGTVFVYEDYDPEGGMLITTQKEGSVIAEHLGDDRALMLRGHGAVVVGESITEAVLASIKLEYNARMIHMQACIGEPWYLPEENLRTSEESMYTEAFMEKSIDYYITNS